MVRCRYFLTFLSNISQLAILLMEDFPVRCMLEEVLNIYQRLVLQALYTLTNDVTCQIPGGCDVGVDD